MLDSDLQASANTAAKAILGMTSTHPHEACILVAAHTGSIAHSGRARCVADSLEAAGVSVTRAGDYSQPYAESILGMDASGHAPLLGTDHIEEYARRRCSWGFYNERTLQEHVHDWRNLLKAGHYDVVVGDFAIPAIIAADSLGIPSVSLQNALWTSVFRCRLTPPEDHWMHHLLVKARLGWLSRAASRQLGATNFFYAIFQRAWARPYNAVRLRYGMRRRSSYFAHTEGQLVLVTDTEMIWRRYGRPDSPKYLAVGPIVWEPDQSLNTPNSPIQRIIDSNTPFIYATLGSSGSRRAFELLFQTFARRKDSLILVLTTGDQFKSWEGWSHPPKNVVMEPFYPGRRVLEAQNCLATINHGGSGSAYQAMLSAPDKPFIMIPTHADQQWNAQILEELGFGIRLSSNQMTPAQLNRAIDRVLASRHHQIREEA